MKTTVTIGIVTGAGCLFALAAPLVAQDDQPLRYHGSRAQVTPGSGPVRRQRFQSDRETGDRTRTMVPDRTVTPELGNLRGGPRPVSPPPRPKTKKLRAKPHVQPERKNSDPGSVSARNEHSAASDRHDGEHTTASPARATPAPVISPSRAPAPAPAPAPVVAPPVSPPVRAAAPERVGQLPGQPGLQQTPSHVQRPTLDDLSENERAKLHSAHQSAFQHDPNLAASRARYLNARKEFRQKLRDALLKADPSVQPILEKIRRDKPEGND